ncbi:MAG: hypothetical protein ACYCSI_07295 [Solirubrobacteraceae bacterium]
MILTPERVASMPTAALSGLLTALEAFGVLLESLDDYEGAIVQLDGHVEVAVHVMDAELQRRTLMHER